MTLHMLNRGLGAQRLIEKCVSFCNNEDCLVLIEDGVYWALKTQIQENLNDLIENNIKIYALRPDIEARGLVERATPQVKIIDYSDLVELTEKYSRSVSWF